MAREKFDLKGLKILFVAYFYPPVSSTIVPGALRSVKFIRNFHNGNYYVLTIPEEHLGEESALSHLNLPINGEHIHRVKSWDLFKFLLSFREGIRRILRIRDPASSKEKLLAQKGLYKGVADEEKNALSLVQRLKEFIHNSIYFPDFAGPWIIPASLYGARLVKRENINAIFATGSPWSGLITGYLIAKVTGKPLIVDFRDPWTNNPFLFSKGKMLDILARFLERQVVKSASCISLNTEPLREEFLSRFPSIPEDRFIVLPNGFDMADIDFTMDQNEGDLNNDQRLVLAHGGYLYGLRDPAVLLDAIIEANKELQEKNKKICFKQIGKVELNYDISERYSEMLTDGSLILEPSLPYKKCLSILKSSDLVVNIQPGTKTQVPSKLYDYLSIDRPILTISDRAGALGQLVENYQLGDLFSFDEQKALTQWLIDLADSLDKDEAFHPYPAKDVFDCTNIANTLAEKLAHVSQR